LRMLKGEFMDGDRILIDSNGDGLTFEKQPALVGAAV
jgi:hypothetical protein